jgi:hypothetical protein
VLAVSAATETKTIDLTAIEFGKGLLKEFLAYEKTAEVGVL